MKRIIICLAITASFVVPATVQAATCHEDMACWNWTKMGDYQRGIITHDGRKHVVTRIDFCHWYPRISWNLTPRLKGDPSRRTCRTIRWQWRNEGGPG